MMTRIFLSLVPIWLAVSTQLAVGQEATKPTPSALRKLEAVRQQFIGMEWEKALEGARKLTEGFPAWQEAWLLRAAICEEAGLKDFELESLEKAAAIDPQSCTGCFLRMAGLKFNAGDYLDASGYLERHHLYHPGIEDEPGRAAHLGLRIAFALDQLSRRQPAIVEPLPASVNTEADEYFPSLTIDGALLTFTRQKWVVEGTGKRPGQEDLYRVNLTGDGAWRADLFPQPVNSGGNEGTMSLSQDGRVMIFTACGHRDSKGSCDLYFSYLYGNEWLIPVNAGYPVNTRYWESTPFLAPDGQTLYFSSNRPGGVGGMDLWYSKKAPDGGWMEPLNLGKPVNTPGNELSPFMLPDGLHLFFASDGHIGMGGTDLYRSRYDDSLGWGVPVNLGYPVNTHFDEDALTMPGSADYALFASNRSTDGGKDIYRFIPSDSIRPPRSVIVRGKVKDRVTGHPVRAAVEIASTGDAAVSRVESDVLTGEFLMGMPASRFYRVNVSSPGYLFLSSQIDGDTLTRHQLIEKEFLLDPILVGSTIILRNVFFETDSYELLPPSTGELQELLKLINENQGLVVEIGGHTDTTGSAAYNRDLSLKRAESVRNYLINRGVSPERLSISGYGDTVPVATNETPEGRSQNRRTEIRILKTN